MIQKVCLLQLKSVGSASTMGITIRRIAGMLSLALLLAGNLPAAIPNSFQFQGVPEQALVGVPVQITIHALNTNNALDTNFTAEVPLRAQFVEPPSIVFSEINITNDVIELINPGTVPVDMSGWELQLDQHASSEVAGMLVHFDFPAQTVVPPQGTILFSTRELTDSAVPVFVAKPYVGDVIFPAVRFELRNASGVVMDQLFASTPPMNEADLRWRGPAISRGLGGAWRWHRTGARNHFATNDWTSGAGVYGAPHPNLRLPWTNEVATLAMAPASVPFTNGIWSGTITFPMAASGVMLRVFSDAGANGQAGPIEIAHAPFPSATTNNALARLFIDPARSGRMVEGMGFQAQPTRVFLSEPATNDVVVTLHADHPLRAPSQLVIPRGQSSADFFLHLGEDSVYQGTNRLWLRAEANDWEPAAVSYAIQDDNEDPLFHAIAPWEVPENSPVQVEVRFAAPRPYDLAISVTSDSPERLIVPGSVVLPAGQTNIWFTLAVPNNDQLDFVVGARVRLNTAENGYTDFVVALVDDEVTVEKLVMEGVAPSQLVGRPIPLTVQLANFHGFVQRTNTTGELRLIDSGQTIPFSPRAISFTNGVWAGEIVIDAVGANVHFKVEAAGFSARSTSFDVFAGTNIIVAPLDAVWDRSTETFLVSEGPATNAGGRLLAIDPATGGIVRSLALPKPATKIVLSEDGSVAWLASARETLQRVDLTSWAAPVEFAANPAAPTQGAKDLVLLHGSTNRVVALVGPIGIPTPTEWRLALFENGVRQTNAAAITDSTFNAQLAQGDDGSEVILETYSYLSRYAISSNVITFAMQTNAPISGADLYNLETKAGQLFHSAGVVIDPSTLVTERRLVDFPFGGALMAAEPEISRAYFLWGSGFYTVDIESSQTVGVFSYEHLLAEFPPKELLSWPGEGFAFLTAGNILFLRTPLAGGNAADLSLTFLGPTLVTNQIPNGSAFFDWSFQVTNHGPGIAPLAVLSLGESSRVDLGTLLPGETRQVATPSGKSGNGIRFETVGVSSAAHDPTPSNNIALAWTAITPGGTSNIMMLPLSSLAVSPDRDLLYGGFSTMFGATAPGVAVIDPQLRQVLRVLPIPDNPMKIEVSSDHRFLFAQLGNDQVLRWDLLADQIDTLVTLTNEAVLDIALLPGEPSALAVVTTQRVLIMDGTSLRPAQKVRSGDNAGVGFAGGRLWLAEPGVLTSFSVSANGLNQESSIDFSLNGGSCDFVSNGRYLYFRTGAFDTQTGQGSTLYSGLSAMHAAPDLPLLYSVGWRSVSRRELWPPAEIAMQNVPLPDPVFDIVAWGESGLAIRAADQQLFILESALVPTFGSADVGVSIVPPQNAFYLDTVEWRLIVTNHSSEDALRVDLSFDIPASDVLRDVTIEGPEFFRQYFTIYSSIDRLAAHSSIEFRIRGLSMNGTASVSANVITATLDTNNANNTAASSVYITSPRADVAVLEFETVEEANVGEQFEAAITVTNLSPVAVQYVSLTFPRNGAFEIVSTDSGEIGDGDLYFNLPVTNTLAAHSALTVTAQMKLVRGGLVPTSAFVGGNFTDDVPANNGISTAIFGTPAETDGWTHLPSTLLTWSDTRQELIGAIAEGTGRVFALDPRTLHPSWQVELPGLPRFIALTSDALFLWAGLDSGEAVRINLDTREIDSSVQLYATPGYFHGLGVPAGETNVVFAILDPGFLGNPQIIAYRDGIPLPRTVPLSGQLFTTPAGRTFLYSPGRIYELELLPDGLSVPSVYNQQLVPFGEQEIFAQGNTLYFTSGVMMDLDAITSEARWPDSSPIGLNFERNELYDQVGNNFIRAWDLTTSEAKWSYQITNRFEAAQFVSLGTNGVLVPGSAAHVIRPDTFESGVELSIAASATNFLGGTNLPIFIPIEIRNNSRFAPRNARLNVTLTPGLALVDFPAGIIPLGTFFTETNITLNLLATQSGEQRLTISVQNDVADRSTANNTWEHTVVVAPKPTLLLENLAVREGQQAFFHLSAPATHDFEVQYWIELLTASRSDLTTTNGTLIFRAPSRLAGLSFTSFDILPEADEVIRIHFASSDVELIRSSIDVRIIDDDLPFITSSNLTFIEGNNGASNAFFSVTLSAVSEAPVQVQYDITPGTATAGIDFIGSSGTYYFRLNQKTIMIPVSVIGDTNFEPAETVLLNLRSASGALLRTLSSQLSIANDDLPPAVTLQVENMATGPALVFFDTVPGASYELQHRTNLAQGSWIKTNLVLTNIGNTATTRMPPGFLRVLAR
jgi:hypothetical protein